MMVLHQDDLDLCQYSFKISNAHRYQYPLKQKQMNICIIQCGILNCKVQVGFQEADLLAPFRMQDILPVVAMGLYELCNISFFDFSVFS